MHAGWSFPGKPPIANASGLRNGVMWGCCDRLQSPLISGPQWCGGQYQHCHPARPFMSGISAKSAVLSQYQNVGPVVGVSPCGLGDVGWRSTKRRLLLGWVSGELGE